MKYRNRKSLIVVEAEEYEKGMEDGINKYCVHLEKECNYSACDLDINCSYLNLPYINTSEGKKYVDLGDYILTDMKNNKYPCSPDTFELEYEEELEKMISIDKLKQRSEVGMTCNLCGSNKKVKALRFKPKGNTTTIYLCSSCRTDLVIELECVENEEAGWIDYTFKY